MIAEKIKSEYKKWWIFNIKRMDTNKRYYRFILSEVKKKYLVLTSQRITEER